MSWFRGKFGVGWWNLSGLAAAASAGADELEKRGMNRAIYDSPKYGVTVVIAKGARAQQLHDWFDPCVSVRQDDGLEPIATETEGRLRR